MTQMTAPQNSSNVQADLPGGTPDKTNILAVMQSYWRRRVYRLVPPPLQETVKLWTALYSSSCTHHLKRSLKIRQSRSMPLRSIKMDTNKTANELNGPSCIAMSELAPTTERTLFSSKLRLDTVASVWKVPYRVRNVVRSGQIFMNTAMCRVQTCTQTNWASGRQ